MIGLNKAYQVPENACITNLGTEYERNLLALLCLRCLAQSVVDMWMVSNDKAMEPLGDIIMWYRTAEGENISLLVQLKHKKNDRSKITRVEFLPATDLQKHAGTVGPGGPKNKRKQGLISKNDSKKQWSLLRAIGCYFNQFFYWISRKFPWIPLGPFAPACKGGFSLIKYVKAIGELKKNLERKAKGIFKDLGLFKGVYITIFTTKDVAPDECEFLVKAKPAAISSIRLLDTKNLDIYGFDFSKLASVNADFGTANDISSKFFLFANQENANVLTEQVVAEIKNIFNAMGVAEIDAKTIADHFISYIKHWTLGNFGEHYFLTRQEVLYKLCDIYFRSFELDLAHQEFASSDSPKTMDWEDSVGDEELIQIESGSNHLQWWSQHIDSEVKQCYEGPAVNWTHDLPQDQQASVYKLNGNLIFKQQLLKIVRLQGTVRPLDIYRCKCMLSELPWLLRLSTPKDLDNIKRVLGFSGGHFKIVTVKEREENVICKPNVPRSFEVICQDTVANLIELLHQNPQDDTQISVTVNFSPCDGYQKQSTPTKKSYIKEADLNEMLRQAVNNREGYQKRSTLANAKKARIKEVEDLNQDQNNHTEMVRQAIGAAVDTLNVGCAAIRQQSDVVAGAFSNLGANLHVAVDNLTVGRAAIGQPSASEVLAAAFSNLGTNLHGAVDNFPVRRAANGQTLASEVIAGAFSNLGTNLHGAVDNLTVGCAAIAQQSDVMAGAFNNVGANLHVAVDNFNVGCAAMVEQSQMALGAFNVLFNLGADLLNPRTS